MVDERFNARAALERLARETDYVDLDADGKIAKIYLGGATTIVNLRSSKTQIKSRRTAEALRLLFSIAIIESIPFDVVFDGTTFEKHFNDLLETCCERST